MPQIKTNSTKSNSTQRKDDGKKPRKEGSDDDKAQNSSSKESGILSFLKNSVLPLVVTALAQMVVGQVFTGNDVLFNEGNEQGKE